MASGTKKQKTPQPECLKLGIGGRFVGYQRNKVRQKCNKALIQIEGVHSREEVAWYRGKRVIFTEGIKNRKININGEIFPGILGKICKAHGNNGLVIVKFQKNLPSQTLGCRVKIMLFPQSS